jgi:hypothetical protein
VGSPCPTDGWPVDLPSGATVHHVRAGSSAGDGLRTSPYGSLAEAVVAANAGDVIALAPGTYPDVITLPMGVALVGACAADTFIEGPAGSIADAAIRLSDGTSVRDVTVIGARPGIQIFEGEARVSDVIIAASKFGIVASGTGRLIGDHLVIRDTLSEGEYGVGLFVNRDAHVEISSSVFEGNTMIGAIVGDPGGVLRLTDVAIRNTWRLPEGNFGTGVAANGGTLFLTRVLVEHASSTGVLVQTGANATLDTLVIRDVESDEISGATGSGLGILTAATVDATRVYISEATTAGLLGVGLRVHHEIRDLIIDAIRPQIVDQRAGVGVFIDSVPDAFLERVLTRGTHGAAVATTGTGVTLSITDYTAIDLLAEESGEFGVAAAVDVRGGGTFTIRRMFAEGARGAAVLVTDPETVLTLEDATIRDTRATDDGIGGRAASVQLGARFD